jgi:hypothetical protein
LPWREAFDCSERRATIPFEERLTRRKRGAARWSSCKTRARRAVGAARGLQRHGARLHAGQGCALGLEAATSAAVQKMIRQRASTTPSPLGNRVNLGQNSPVPEGLGYGRSTPESGRKHRTRSRAVGVSDVPLTFRKDGEGQKSQQFERGLSVLATEVTQASRELGKGDGVPNAVNPPSPGNALAVSGIGRGRIPGTESASRRRPPGAAFRFPSNGRGSPDAFDPQPPLAAPRGKTESGHTHCCRLRATLRS